MLIDSIRRGLNRAPSADPPGVTVAGTTTCSLVKKALPRVYMAA